MTTYNFVPARNRKYGWIPDRPDPRDVKYASIAPEMKVPDKVDLRKYCSAVEDQGKLSSCVGNACAGALETLENMIAPQNYQDISRLFIYYNARALLGWQFVDQGASIRDALKTLNTLGYCWEKDWGYNLSAVNDKPTKACYDDAITRPISMFARIANVDEMITCLADGFPVVLGITIFDNFATQDARDSGLIGMPSKRDGSLGGHAVLCVGYNKRSKEFIMRNSWGSMWGISGYFMIPFNYITQYGSDMWTIRK